MKTNKHEGRGVAITERRKLINSVNELDELQQNNTHNLKQMGYTIQEIEAAVRDGDLEWLRDGRVRVAE